MHLLQFCEHTPRRHRVVHNEFQYTYKLESDVNNAWKQRQSLSIF